MSEPWSADLPSLPDERACRYVLAVLTDVLAYRDVTRDDVRDAYARAAKLAATYGASYAEARAAALGL